MIRKVGVWGGIAFLIFMVAYRPDIAADVFWSLGRTVRDIAVGTVDFVRNIG